MGLILISTMGILVMVFFIIVIVLLYQKKLLAHKSQVIENERLHQKKLLDASLEIAQKERFTIATNLHDDVGMMLNVLKLNLRKVQNNMNNQALLNEIISTCNGIIDDSIGTIRTISNNLMPPTLINLGFVKGMKELCRQINLSGTAEVTFISEHESIVLDKKVELQAYHLVKELLNNTIRHATPSFIEIIIETKNNKIFISIFHNGMGIETEKIKGLAEVSTGLGLKSIFTRSQLINACLEFKILNPKTSLVSLEIPL